MNGQKSTADWIVAACAWALIALGVALAVYGFRVPDVVAIVGGAVAIGLGLIVMADEPPTNERWRP